MSDEEKMCTTSGEAVAKVRAEQTNPTGQHRAYLILCDEEREKGFVKPYRDSYKHVGIRPRYATRELTADEQVRHHGHNYVAYEEYPPAEGTCVVGRFWTAAQLASGCGTITTMGRTIAETYARDPYFYGATFCVRCNRHIELEQFAWEPDGEPMDPNDPAWRKPEPA